MTGGEEELRGYRIRGRVQGVFFRAWTRDTAVAFGLKGAVRNLPDGSVEAWAQGESGLLEEFEERLWEGPLAARVEKVDRCAPGGDLPHAGFVILR